MAKRPERVRPPREYGSKQRRIFQRKLSMERNVAMLTRREQAILAKLEALQPSLSPAEYAAHPMRRELKSLDRMKRKEIATIAAVERVLANPSRSEE